MGGSASWVDVVVLNWRFEHDLISVCLCIIKLVMKQPEKSSRKHMGDLRKHSISEKTRSDNNPAYKEEQYTALLCRDMKSLGRKYAQENVFKGKDKGEHHEIVISDELVRNSKQFRMLREKIQMREALFGKEFGELSETRSRLRQEVSEIKTTTYNTKLALWELKNQILQLKGVLNDQEEESRRLQQELSAPPNPHFYQDQQEQEPPQDEEQYDMEGQPYGQYQQQEQQQMEGHMRIHSEERLLEEEQVEVRMAASELNPIRINPESASPFKKAAD